MGALPWWAWAMLAGASLAMALRASLHVVNAASHSHGRGHVVEPAGGRTERTEAHQFDPSSFHDLLEDAASVSTHRAMPSEAPSNMVTVSAPFKAVATTATVGATAEPVPAVRSDPSVPPADTSSTHRVKQSSWHGTQADALATCGKLAETLASQQERYKGRKPVVWRCGCKVSGLGDRLKGIVAAWMLANVLERPFLCDPFPSIAQHTYGVEPVDHNWRDGYAEYAASDRVSAVFKTRAEAALLSSASSDYTRAIEIVQTTPAKVSLVQAYIKKMGLNVDADILSTEPFVGDGKNFTNDDAPLLSHGWRAVYAQATYCATRSLFRPTKAMLELLDDTLTTAVRTGSSKKVAVNAHSTTTELDTDLSNSFVVGLHVRFGGKWQDRKRARDDDAIKIIECAWNMTSLRKSHLGIQASGVAMWVLASDDVERLRSLVSAFAVLGGVRERWAAQRIAVVVAEGGKVEHVSKSVNGTDKDSVRRLWHDWFLMSEAHSCALIRSSFPRTACYASARRASSSGLVQQLVTSLDLGRYTRTTPSCTAWNLASSRS